MSEEERQQSFREAQQSLDNLNELLFNLLQWSRSQMDILEYRPEPLPMNQLIAEALRMTGLHAQLKQIEIKATVADNCMALGDREMVAFILRNLIINAIKFSYRQAIVIISAREEEKAVLIEVTDFGVGMSEAKIKKLLEKHTTITRRGTEKEKGTGLGLLISKEFIERNGGQLKIKSELGKGSTFTFTLPLKV
jgi:two-component system sensor histidine kinase/response regulator